MIYVCEDCGKEFDELQTITERHPYGEGCAEEELCIRECDECGGYVVEAEVCPICNEKYLVKYSFQMCNDCFEASCTLENSLEMGNEVTEEYNINGFLASVYTPQEIEDLLLADFNKIPKHMQDEYITRYCAEDKFFFTDFLKEKMKNADLH